MIRSGSETRIQGLLALLAVLAGCDGRSPAAEAPDADDGRTGAAGCPPDARLDATLYGALAGRLEWRAGDMECSGMPRPAGRGGRLRIAGPSAGGEATLALIVGIPALEEGAGARELPTNVTIIEEGAGRFFSARDDDSCWTDVASQDRIAGSLYRLRGVTYCVRPLAEVNGGAAVRFDEIAFTGIIDWTPAE